jgi:hypothetical protein
MSHDRFDLPPDIRERVAAQALEIADLPDWMDRHHAMLDAIRDFGHELKLAKRSGKFQGNVVDLKAAYETHLRRTVWELVELGAIKGP